MQWPMCCISPPSRYPFLVAAPHKGWSVGGLVRAGKVAKHCGFRLLVMDLKGTHALPGQPPRWLVLWAAVPSSTLPLTSVCLQRLRKAACTELQCRVRKRPQLWENPGFSF